MGTFPDALKRLVDRFNQQSDAIRSPDYNETLIRVDFINPMMAALGWDMNNTQGHAEQYREVVHEDRVKVAGQTKAPDYSFRIGGQRKFFLEAKKPSVDIKNNWEPAYQLRRYAWSAKLAVSLLTDFEEFAIYDARLQPKQMEKASVARREFIKYTDYADRWDFISGTFSKDAVLRGEFDRYCETKKGRGASLFDDAFLGEIEEWRTSIASTLARNNPSLDEPALNFAVQRIIDRIIFLRIAEDRGTETVGQLQQLLNGEAVYPRLVTLFNRADERYNSGLFHFAREKDRDESPDTLTPTLSVDDKTLKTIIKGLYYPQSPYEFTMVSADILGSVYERFLGKVITLTSAHKAKIEEKPEVRKAGGVYYTPVYIVDYIVKNTVGKLLGAMEGGCPQPPAPGGRGRPPSKLKILDPACGSGSFLIGAYQFLLDWYLQQYTAPGSDPAALATGKNPVLRPAFVKPVDTSVEGPVTPGWALTIAERKRILLDHIHGVDLDGQAVEVTKLNLLLKCLEGETSQTLGFEQRLFRERALPDLGKNILCGNSLIGTDIMGTDAWNAMSEEEREKVNPFDYERGFPAVFKGKDAGFDAVIGNPPYVRQEVLGDAFKAYAKNTFSVFGSTADLYVYFFERSAHVLRFGGLFGMISSNKFMKAEYGRPLRKFLAQKVELQRIVDFGELPVFVGAATFPAVILWAKLAPSAEPRSDLSYSPIQTLEFQSLDAGVTTTARIVSRDQIVQENWRLVGEGENLLLNKLDSAGVTLKVGYQQDVYLGIKTGLNDAFIVDGETRDDLIRRNPNSSVLLPRLAIGDDVRRYRINNSDTYLAAIACGWTNANCPKGSDPWQWFSSTYPAVAKHLLKFKDKAETRTDQGDYWWELRPCDYFDKFRSPKIVYPEIAKESRFTLDRDGYFTNNKTFFVPSDDPVLLGILGSRVVWFQLKRLCSVLGDSDRGGRLELRRVFMQRVKLPREVAKKDHTRLASLVDTMLALHKRLSAEQTPSKREQIQREIDATDRQIDQLVYQLYGLTDDEIRIVEEATA